MKTCSMTIVAVLAAIALIASCATLGTQQQPTQEDLLRISGKAVKLTTAGALYNNPQYLPGAQVACAELTGSVGPTTEETYLNLHNLIQKYISEMGDSDNQFLAKLVVSEAEDELARLGIDLAQPLTLEQVQAFTQEELVQRLTGLTVLTAYFCEGVKLATPMGN